MSDIKHLKVAPEMLNGSGMDVPRTGGKRKRVVRGVVLGVVAAVVVAGAALALTRIKAAPPSVKRGLLWTDKVKRGPMVRQVQGQGTLAPEEIRVIAAPAAGRVERIAVERGAIVTPETLLVELVNPDVELAALEADRALASAEATLATLGASTEGDRLGQQSLIANLESQLGDAKRRAAADEDLAKKGFLSELELGQSRDRATELDGRLKFEKKRLTTLDRGGGARVTAQRSEIARLAALVDFRRRQLEALKVRAGVSGVLQDLPLEAGQSVAAGQALARVVNAARLKAEVLIPETMAREVRIGQTAILDLQTGTTVPGKVSRIDPAVQAGTVRVDVKLDGALPDGARPDQTLTGVIELERLDDVLSMGRPAFSNPGGQVSVFLVDPDGKEAVRTRVQLGRTSVKAVEITGGLREGDLVILSDMTEWDGVDRLRIEQ
jgi:HlyD family secretion protein